MSILTILETVPGCFPNNHVFMRRNSIVVWSSLFPKYLIGHLLDREHLRQYVNELT